MMVFIEDAQKSDQDDPTASYYYNDSIYSTVKPVCNEIQFYHKKA